MDIKEIVEELKKSIPQNNTPDLFNGYLEYMTNNLKEGLIDEELQPLLDDVSSLKKVQKAHLMKSEEMRKSLAKLSQVDQSQERNIQELYREVTGTLKNALKTGLSSLSERIDLQRKQTDDKIFKSEQKLSEKIIDETEKRAFVDHKHKISDIKGFDKEILALENKIDEKAPIDHKHEEYVTKDEVKEQIDKIPNFIGGGGTGQAPIQFKDEGVNLGGRNVGTIDFVGSAITATRTGSDLTVTVGGGDVVNDLTPQLGGNLDVNGKYIVSVDNGDIVIAADGTGITYLNGNSYANNLEAGTLTMASGTSISDPDGNEIIEFTTDGSDSNMYLGVWATQSGGSSTGPIIYTAGTPTDIDLQIVLQGDGDLRIVGNLRVDSTYHTYFQSTTANGNSGTADTIDWGNGNIQTSTLTGNCTFTFTAPKGPCNLQLILTQDGVGGRTVTRPASVKRTGGVAPVLTTDAGGIDIISFLYDGTNYYGTETLDMQ